MRRDETKVISFLPPPQCESVNRDRRDRDRGERRSNSIQHPLALQVVGLLLLVRDLGVDQRGDPGVAGVELLEVLLGRGDGLFLFLFFWKDEKRKASGGQRRRDDEVGSSSLARQ